MNRGTVPAFTPLFTQKKEPARAGSGMLRISDDREDIFKKYELDECEPGDDLHKSLKSVVENSDVLFFEVTL